MSMNTVSRTLTPEMAAAASTLVKMARAGDTSLSRALDRAQERLFSQPWALVGGILQIASVSEASEQRATDGSACSCPTTKGTCWHVASYLILSSIAGAGVLPYAPLPLPFVMDDDELPGEYFLDGPFDAYDDSELTAPEAEPVKREWFSDEGGGDFEEVDRLDEPGATPVPLVQPMQPEIRRAA